MACREKVKLEEWRKGTLSAGSYVQPDPSEWSNKGVSRRESTAKGRSDGARLCLTFTCYIFGLRKEILGFDATIDGNCLQQGQPSSLGRYGTGTGRGSIQWPVIYSCRKFGSYKAGLALRFVVRHKSSKIKAHNACYGARTTAERVDDSLHLLDNSNICRARLCIQVAEKTSSRR